MWEHELQKVSDIGQDKTVQEYKECNRNRSHKNSDTDQDKASATHSMHVVI